MEFLKCGECRFRYACPCGWSNGNAACLTIQQKDKTNEFEELETVLSMAIDRGLK